MTYDIVLCAVVWTEHQGEDLAGGFGVATLIENLSPGTTAAQKQQLDGVLAEVGSKVVLLCTVLAVKGLE